MTLTKQLEAEIKEVMDDYWNSYFRGDIDHWATYLVNDYRNIGGTEEEIWNAKKEILDYTFRVIDQMVGKTDIRNKEIEIIPYDPYIMVHEFMDLFIKVDDEWKFYGKFRLSSLIQKIGDVWKVLHQHGSYPDSYTEQGESFAFDKLREENTQLRAAVKRRTIELESKNRELEIEASLERVRSRTMAMHQSSELNEAAELLYRELTKLGIKKLTCGYTLLYDRTSTGTCYMANPEGSFAWDPFHLDHSGSPGFHYIYESWKKQEPFHSFKLSGKANVEHNKYLAEHAENFPIPTEQLLAILPPVTHSNSFNFRFGYLLVVSLSPFTHEQVDIIKRFTNVFEQTYTRFLDLQKAEAQAREARIETALEKVRSQSLAMHKSDELQEVVNTVFEKLQELDIEMDSANIAIFKEGSRDFDYWVASDFQKRAASFYMPYTELLLTKDLIAARESGTDYSAKSYSLEEKNEWFNYAFSNTDFKFLTAERKQFILSAPAITVSIAFSKYTGVQVIRYSTKLLSEGEIQILKRFSKVFEQAYVRFLDLQKAEAQAREAQAEAALEKVRSRTMAMHRSNELLDVINVVSEQLRNLNFKFDNVCLGINNQDYDIDFWMAAKGQPCPLQIHSPYIDNPLVNRIIEARKNGLDFFTDTCNPEENREWISHTIRSAGEEIFSEQTMAFLLNSPGYSRSTVLMENINFFIGNYAAHPYSEEENVIFKRFANVIGQSYTRFLDLQKAETQAREAQIAAALERVRSRTLAMQKSDELAETAAVLFQQLIALGIEPNRLYISIIKSEKGDTEFWITNEHGSKVSTAFIANMHENAILLKMFEGWKQQQKSLVIDMQGEELQNYFRHLTSLGVPFKEGLTEKRRVQEIAYFSKGFIGMASPDEQPAETLQLLERFAAVFNLTFTRFNDLKVAEAHARQAEQDLKAIKEAKQKAEEALTELQSTQKQLIQSEKMASLGELTAGIAHEIQNPLNFVNNFSEVSKEMLNEMKEAIKKGYTEEAKEIMKDVIQNLEKINFHGKRADGIVKSMLQHSRTSTGQKEPTNINALVDEYLRLAYHGLRAKEKSFNATLVTDYDKTIGAINVIPQDIGRVILNLITNAFYAVDKKNKLTIDGYQPTVSVVTKKFGDKVLISVHDNGSGIPQNIVGKIFQPFFTTKPTGQGTGLGLSLAYDIVKAHGGELKVETKEGENTTFTMILVNT